VGAGPLRGRAAPSPIHARFKTPLCSSRSAEGRLTVLGLTFNCSRFLRASPGFVSTSHGRGPVS
jgi:hypothetical protein